MPLLAPTAKTAFDIAAVFDEKVPPQKNQIRTPSLLPWCRSAVVPFPPAFAEPDVARWSRNVRERPTSDLMVLGFAVLALHRLREQPAVRDQSRQGLLIWLRLMRERMQFT